MKSKEFIRKKVADMKEFIEGYDDKKGYYVIDVETGETYMQEEFPELIHQITTEAFGHELEYYDEASRKLGEELQSLFRSGDLSKSPWGPLFGLSDKEGKE